MVVPPLLIDRKRDYLWFYQFLEIFVCQLDKFTMGTGIKRNFPVFSQGFCYKNLHSVEIAKRRHGANFTIGEQVFKFLFIGNFNGSSPGGLFQKIKIYLTGSRKDGHCYFPI